MRGFAALWLMGACAALSAHAGELGGAVSAEARTLAQWAIDTNDAQGRPFAIVDKNDARLFVFAADGSLLGAAPALLGSAKGDTPSAAVRRVPERIPVDERTTPAGRFDSEPGHNDKGEAIVWVDYANAIAIHRLRPADPAERRPQRLASPTPADNRISLGCIVVSPAFYDAVVATTLGRERGAVYVLPETGGWRALFGIPGRDDL